MPKLDGHQVLEQLKLDDALRDVPVVFLTGRSSAEDLAEGLRLGAHDYLRKPFEPAELLARVRTAVRTKALHDELRYLNEQLTRLASTDILTGLANRLCLEEQLTQLAARSRRHGARLGVVLLDVDRFKAINDTRGHAVGDAVLRAVASRLDGRMRIEDTLGRWGGEEFLALAGDTAGAGVAALAEGLRGVVAQAPVVVEGRPVGVTISAGWTSWRTGDRAEDLLRRADDALYEAKRDGRNLVRGNV